MEQASGMAWVTGYLDGTPTIPGICDPLAGAHAAFAVISALEHRAQTGEGQQIELAMIDMASNLVSEQVLEHSVYGHLMTREGNRSTIAAPQGVYTCDEPDQWVALAVATDDEWQALRTVLGSPPWSTSPELQHADGRRLQHDLVDAELATWFAGRSQKEALAALAAADVPAEPVVHAYDVDNDDQMNARGFWEPVAHPVVGTHRFPGWPIRYSEGPSRWFRAAAPLLGQHTEGVLRDELGISDDELSALREARVIGTRPAGV
jgi:crotonobetainyl-CoA:carnitine CoA-transferase CaiB-like acyl-CoA transferase